MKTTPTLQRFNASKVRGFTLIELLVVIAIIGLLAAITMPALSAAKQKAQKTVDVSNMKQMGVAFSLYFGDNSDQIPYAGVWTTANQRLSFDDLLANYLGQNLSQADMDAYAIPTNTYCRVLSCPLDNIVRSGIVSWAASIPRTYSMPRSNSKIYPTPGGGVGVGYLNQVTAPAQIKTTMAQDPAGTLMLLENPSAGNYAGGTPESWVNNAAFYSSFSTSFHASGSYSWLFVDTHVESLKPIQTVGTGTLTNVAGMWTMDLGD